MYSALLLLTNLTEMQLCRVIADLGAKTRVMELMGHDDPDVRYQALISVQRLISHPWKS
jgi:V-type H+-transporting ATPase subunit H